MVLNFTELLSISWEWGCDSKSVLQLYIFDAVIFYHLSSLMRIRTNVRTLWTFTKIPTRIPVYVMLISAWPQYYSTIRRVYEHLGHFSRSEHDFRSNTCKKLRQWAKPYITLTEFSTFVILRQAKGRNPSVSLQATKLATNRIFIGNLMQNRRLQTHLQCKPIKSRFCVRSSIWFAPHD